MYWYIEILLSKYILNIEIHFQRILYNVTIFYYRYKYRGIYISTQLYHSISLFILYLSFDTYVGLKMHIYLYFLFENITIYITTCIIYRMK